ncbi:MAG: hypothetical protein M0D55_03490 [Elusimicrobiota bacterium]|nr:MAG: hypothetical protein M0D55_03490 [Elusimicrobiota bacterium]
MARRPLRLPASFLYLPAGFFGMFALIAGGVAVSQHPFSDWTAFLIMLAGLAVCGAIYRFGPFEWIRDAELQRMEKRERDAEFEAELEEMIRENKVEEVYRRKKWWMYASYPAVLLLLFHEYWLGDATMADGSRGFGAFGLSLGTWRIFRRDWTGVEVLIMAGGLAVIAYYLRRGFVRLLNAQR